MVLDDICNIVHLQRGLHVEAEPGLDWSEGFVVPCPDTHNSGSPAPGLLGLVSGLGVNLVLLLFWRNDPHCLFGNLCPSSVVNGKLHSEKHSDHLRIT